MIEALTYNPQPENWLYEIRQKGHDSTCYVMVPHARVGVSHFTQKTKPTKQANKQAAHFRSLDFVCFAIGLFCFSPLHNNNNCQVKKKQEEKTTHSLLTHETHKVSVRESA